MKKLALAVIGLALTGGFVVSAPMAFAAETPCSTALLAQADLDAQVKVAEVADKAAADAKTADDAAADAAAAVDTARSAAVNGGLSSAELTSAKLKALRDERTAILAVPVADRTPVQVDRLIVLERQIPLVEAFLAAEIKAATSKAAADKTDADALRREADKTDVDALRVKLAAAVKAATDACKGADATLVPVPSPAPQVVVIPRAIDTGEA